MTTEQPQAPGGEEAAPTTPPNPFLSGGIGDPTSVIPNAGLLKDAIEGVAMCLAAMAGGSTAHEVQAADSPVNVSAVKETGDGNESGTISITIRGL